MTTLLWIALSAHAIDVQALRDRIEVFDAHARYPLPTLSDADLQRLLDGKLVRVREVPPDGPQRVTGLLVVSQPKTSLFVSAHDPHLAAVDEVTEVQVNPGTVSPKRWVQVLHLPRPFADRYWVVDVRDNVQLAEATGGSCWEHWWTLADNGPRVALESVAAGKVPGITAGQLDSAVYAPDNNGAFVYLDLPDGRTLFGFHAQSTVGGKIPDGLVARYTQATVGAMLRTIADRVELACTHYDAAHEPLPGGDGEPIPPGCG